MRKRLLVLGACLALILTMGGCSDDDVVPLAPTQQAAATGVGAITTVNSLVVALLTALGGPAPLGGDGGLGGSCKGGLVNISQQVCTGGGMADLCEFPLFVNLTDCSVTGVGVLDGAPAISLTKGGYFVDVTVDGDTTINGIIGIDLLAEEGGGGPICETLFYNNLTVADGAAATINGSIDVCEDGSVFGFAQVDIPESAVSMDIGFGKDGNSAFIEIYELGTKNFLGYCEVSPLDGVPECFDEKL